MSLVVSLRIPDGVVIAADSLSTVQGRIALQPELKAKCPECKKNIELRNLPTLQLPLPAALSTSSFSQKLFPFGNKFGIGAFGLSILLGRTVGYWIENLEREVDAQAIQTATELAEIVQSRFDVLVHKQFKDVDKAPNGFYPLGFHVVGYDGDDGKTLEVKIGKKSIVQPQVGLGCTVSGAMQVVQKLWELSQQDHTQRTNYEIFSLQDAIDYADFLIKTTASYQRFALMIPNVGGQVDIALVTPYRGFAWIRQKKLSRVILGGE